MKKYAFLCLLATTVSCQHASAPSMAKSIKESDDSTFPSPVTCEDNNPATIFSLVSQYDAKKSDVNLTGTYTLQRMGIEELFMGVRAELCIGSDDKVVLKRLITRIPAAGFAFSFPHMIYTPDDAGSADLGDALFTGDLSGIEVKFTNSTDPDRSYMLKGWTAASGENFLTFSSFNAALNTPLVVSDKDPTVKYGVLIEGDPFIPKTKEAHRVVDDPKLHAEFWYSYTGGIGIYASYQFKKIAITDKTKTQTFSTVLEDANLTTAMKINYSHHSLFDSFLITIGKRRYFIESGKLSVMYGDSTTPLLVVPMTCEFAQPCAGDTGGGVIQPQSQAQPAGAPRFNFKRKKR